MFSDRETKEDLHEVDYLNRRFVKNTSPCFGYSPLSLKMKQG